MFHRGSQSYAAVINFPIHGFQRSSSCSHAIDLVSTFTLRDYREIPTRVWTEEFRLTEIHRRLRPSGVSSRTEPCMMRFN